MPPASPRRGRSTTCSTTTRALTRGPGNKLRRSDTSIGKLPDKIIPPSPHLSRRSLARRRKGEGRGEGERTLRSANVEPFCRPPVRGEGRPARNSLGDGRV